LRLLLQVVEVGCHVQLEELRLLLQVFEVGCHVQLEEWQGLLQLLVDDSAGHGLQPEWRLQLLVIAFC
jgi:hypothetical protein